MPASVHRRVVGQGGLGSPATQLMRAVRLPPPGGLRVRRCRLPGGARVSGRSMSSPAPGCRRFTGRRFGRGSRGYESASQSRTRAETRRTKLVGRSPRPSRAVFESENRGAAYGVLGRKASWAAGRHHRAAPSQKTRLKAPPLRVERARRPSPGQSVEAPSGRVEFANDSSAASFQAVVLLAGLSRRSEA